MEREWFKMRNIPGVTVLDGSVSNRAHLRAAGINKVDLWIKLNYRIKENIARIEGEEDI